MRFQRNRKLYISAIALLHDRPSDSSSASWSAIMGVGGGFVMVPAMIYLLGMPTRAVGIGTSLFQIVFVTANVTFLQAWQNFTVDIFLALLLLVGGVIGAQFGARAGAKLRGEQLRGLLAVLVLGVATKLLFDLVVTPDDLYSTATRAGGGH